MTATTLRTLFALNMAPVALSAMPNQKGILTASIPELSSAAQRTTNEKNEVRTAKTKYRRAVSSKWRRQNHADPNHQQLNLRHLFYSRFRGLNGATN
jgi:hypothetical protein